MMLIRLALGLSAIIASAVARPPSTPDDQNESKPGNHLTEAQISSLFNNLGPRDELDMPIANFTDTSPFQHAWLADYGLEDGDGETAPLSSRAPKDPYKGKLINRFDKSCNAKQQAAIDLAWHDAHYLSRYLDEWKPKSDYQWHFTVYFGPESRKPNVAFEIKSIIYRAFQFLGGRTLVDVDFTMYCEHGPPPTREKKTPYCSDPTDVIWYDDVHPGNPLQRKMVFCKPFFEKQDHFLDERMALLNAADSHRGCYDKSIMEFYLGTKAQSILHTVISKIILQSKPRLKLNEVSPLGAWALARNSSWHAMQNANNFVMAAISVYAHAEGGITDSPRPSWNKALPAIASKEKQCGVREEDEDTVSFYFPPFGKLPDLEKYNWWGDSPFTVNQAPQWKDPAAPYDKPGAGAIDPRPSCPWYVEQFCRHFPGFGDKGKEAAPGVWWEPPFRERPYPMISNDPFGKYERDMDAEKNQDLDCPSGKGGVFALDYRPECEGTSKSPEKPYEGLLEMLAPLGIGPEAAGRLEFGEGEGEGEGE